MKKVNSYLLAALTAFCFVNTQQVLAAPQQAPAIIYVTGYAEKEAIPDTAIVSLGMETSAGNLDVARNNNVVVMNKLNSAMVGLGIPKEDIKTTEYRVMPRYDKNGEKIVGYIVTNNLKIKVKNLALLPKLFQQAETAGVNQVSNVEFTCSNTATLKSELIQAAVANGRLVAQSAANAAGAQLGKIKEIRINGRYPSFSIVRPENVRLMKANAADAMPVLEQGSQKLSESVDMVFYIEE